ncbi:hypothetical protein M9H77_16754 [Catharanthus roseus]|uniref:Uncharacterized protein n=1 Tax=Catharanthus roseus TaxID=4058 RepID=A0ACC0B2M0_CATRO|nr:hypothetical protein M9H77_16754 [Catharanthus roseus]
MAAVSQKDVYPVKAFGLAARDSSGVFTPFNFSRRDTGEHNVQLKVLYCGVCNFDNEMRRSKFGMTKFPYVGCKVQKFKTGDTVGVSFIIDTCRECETCKNELEMYSVATDGFFETSSYGGCSNIMVVDKNFAVLWPENLPLDSGAPLLCSGITVYSLMRRYGLDNWNSTIRFAKAFGANVTVISSSLKKKEEALGKFGADSFLVSNHLEEMEAANGTLDAILDTLPVVHPLDPLFSLLKPLGKLIIVGAPETPFEIAAPSLLQGGKILAGSAAGSMKETQDMVDFAAKHNIVADVEVIPIDYVNTAMDRIEKSDVKYRFVIDKGNTLKSS